MSHDSKHVELRICCGITALGKLNIPQVKIPPVQYPSPGLHHSQCLLPSLIYPSIVSIDCPFDVLWHIIEISHRIPRWHYLAPGLTSYL